jgi:hypothetical protein
VDALAEHRTHGGRVHHQPLDRVVFCGRVLGTSAAGTKRQT